MSFIATSDDGEVLVARKGAFGEVQECLSIGLQTKLTANHQCHWGRDSRGVAPTTRYRNGYQGMPVVVTDPKRLMVAALLFLGLQLLGKATSEASGSQVSQSVRPRPLQGPRTSRSFEVRADPPRNGETRIPPLSARARRSMPEHRPHRIRGG